MLTLSLGFFSPTSLNTCPVSGRARGPEGLWRALEAPARGGSSAFWGVVTGCRVLLMTQVYLIKSVKEDMGHWKGAGTKGGGGEASGTERSSGLHCVPNSLLSSAIPPCLLRPRSSLWSLSTPIINFIHLLSSILNICLENCLPITRHLGLPGKEDKIKVLVQAEGPHPPKVYGGTPPSSPKIIFFSYWSPLLL